MWNGLDASSASTASREAIIHGRTCAGCDNGRERQVWHIRNAVSVCLGLLREAGLPPVGSIA